MNQVLSVYISAGVDHSSPILDIIKKNRTNDAKYVVIRMIDFMTNKL